MNALKELLKQHTVKVVFTKRDGTQRDMICTLKDELIGSETYSSTPGPEHLVTVWDLEKDAWRSIRLDSIIFYERQVA